MMGVFAEADEISLSLMALISKITLKVDAVPLSAESRAVSLQQSAEALILTVV